MSIKWMLKALETKVGNATKKLILINLCNNANDDGECWPGRKYLSDRSDCSLRTIDGHIDSLEKDGFIKITRRKGPKGNSTNKYKMLFTPSANFAPLENNRLEDSEKSAPPPSAKSAPPEESTPPRGAEFTPPSANSALPPSAESAPGISHSFEPVIKEESALPVIAPSNLFAIDTSIVNKFSMTEDWQPTEKFTNQCKFRGVNLNAFSPDDQEDLINEFRSYWMTRSDQFNQAGWEHKLIANLKSNQDRKSSRNTPHSAQSKRANISAAIMNIEDTNW